MNSTVKTTLIVAGVAIAGFIAWQLYKKSQQPPTIITVPGGTTVNRPAAPAKPAQQDQITSYINAGTAAVSKISEFFND